MTTPLRQLEDCPAELRVSIREFWPESAWDEAASIAWLESGWDAFALADTTLPGVPCGHRLPPRDGVGVTAERSIGYFQINSCNFPDWPWERFFNARHNAGTAHMLWEARRWSPWFFSARSLGLL
jgi:hypothetical protein